VLLFPDGDDPDSFSKKVSGEDLKAYIKKNSNDFIKFKTNLLFEEAKHEPVKKAALVKDIIESIAIVPDAIIRNGYITECSHILQVDEQTLVFQVKATRDKKITKKNFQPEQYAAEQQPQNISEGTNQEVKDDLQKLLDAELNPFTEQEKNLVRLLINYGTHLISIEHVNEDNEKVAVDVSVAEFILHELEQDDISFVDSAYELFLYEFKIQIAKGNIPNTDYFVKHRNPQLAQTTIHLISSNDQLSDKWKTKHNVSVAHETDNLKKSVNHDLFIYKEKRLQKLLRDEKEKLRTATSDEEIQEILINVQKLDVLKSRVNKLLGRTII
jgi:DNA primase